MIKLMLITVMLLTIIHPSSVLVAQEDSVATAKQNLTNGSERKWILKERIFSMVPGPEPRCREGEDWTFYRNERVVVVECVRGKFESEEKTWTLESNEQGRLILRVNGTEYDLRFSSSQDPLNMYLTHYSGPRVNGITNMIFHR